MDNHTNEISNPASHEGELYPEPEGSTLEQLEERIADRVAQKISRRLFEQLHRAETDKRTDHDLANEQDIKRHEHHLFDPLAGP